MIAPLSWLKEYVTISLLPKELGERLTEVGLGLEKIEKTQSDTIFHLEITPNRPDWLSLIGVAREIAAIENKKIRYPNLKTDLKTKKGNSLLPLTIHPDFTVTPRLTGIIINNVTVKESPKWLRDRLTSIGQRPINNIVDITNFVMFELGNPIHSFDYHKIEGHEMWVKQAHGGESFESVDEISYHLPKGAIIFEDKKKIFDLVGIKGGRNSGTYEDTKAVFIAVEVDDPVLIRKASQALSLRSEASAIFERTVNKGGTIDALKRTTDLIIEIAGGEIASNFIDLKQQEFKPWKLQLRLDRLEFILGIKLPDKKVIEILDRLNLSPKLINNNSIETIIPTYRNDIKLEEDLIEEVARIYGYNNFPKTMPEGEMPVKQIPFFKDYKKEEKIKTILQAVGFSEIYTYSLMSEKDLNDYGIHPEHTLRIDNPVSREFEYLRPTLKINLIKALRQNTANFSDIHLFELGNVYLGHSLDQVRETCFLSGISNKKSYLIIKGLLEKIFEELHITEDPTAYIHVLEDGVFFELDFSTLLQKPTYEKKFIPIPKYPGITEDLAFIIYQDVKIGAIIHEIKKQSTLITEVSLLDQFDHTRTFHIVYQDRTKNLTSEDVAKLREKIKEALLHKFSAKLKE